MIAGGGFAQMAWMLARKRTFPEIAPRTKYPPERMTERCEGASEFCEHCEYYNLIDEAAARFNSREDSGYTIYL